MVEIVGNLPAQFDPRGSRVWQACRSDPPPLPQCFDGERNKLRELRFSYKSWHRGSFDYRDRPVAPTCFPCPFTAPGELALIFDQASTNSSENGSPPVSPVRRFDGMTLNCDGLSRLNRAIFRLSRKDNDAYGRHDLGPRFQRMGALENASFFALTFSHYMMPLPKQNLGTSESLNDSN